MQNRPSQLARIALRILPSLLLGWMGLATPAWAFRAPKTEQETARRVQQRQVTQGTFAARFLRREERGVVAPDLLRRDRQHLGLLPTVLPGAPRTEDEVVAVLRSIVLTRSPWLGGLRPTTLRLSHVATAPALGQRPATIHVQFVQQHRGVDVEGTYVHFSVKILAKQSVIVLAQAQVYPRLQLSLFRSRSQATPGQAAKALGLDPTTATPTHTRHVLRYIDGRWRRVLESRFQESAYTGVVDEDTQEQWMQDDRLYGTIQGRVRGRAILFDPLATAQNLQTIDAKDLEVRATSGSVSLSDAAGFFNFPGETSPTTVTATLQGSWATVSSATSPNLSVSGSAVPDVSLNLLFNPTGADELPTAQVNGYVHTSLIHDWVQYRLSPTMLPGLDTPLPVNVNLASTCNAYYDFTSINFYRSGGGCLNTAYDTVIYHEYGHFVDDQAGGILNGGLSEGWGDIVATYGTNQPLIGEGFAGPGTMVRTADNTYQYPLSGQDEVHALGQAWAGFAWHLRQRLIASQGQTAGITLAENLVIPVFLANSPDIPSAAAEVLFRDDDDADLSNGTPHETEIRAAAAQHSIPLPEFDAIPPDPVNDLAATASGLGRITLTWTATGDDGVTGTAARYDIRSSGSSILTEADFQAATPLSGEPVPKPSGSVQSMEVIGLASGTTYFFAMKVVDNAGNASFLSTLASATTVVGTVVLSESFETGAPGWTTTGLWHLSHNRFSSPTASEAYNDGVDYDTGTANMGALTSPPISLANATDALLTFQHWFETESFPGPYDIRRVQLSLDNGMTWLTLRQWDSSMPNQPVWTPVSVDLAPYVGKTMQVRFLFDTVDAFANTFEGWYVDDVQVMTNTSSSNQPPVLSSIGQQTVNEGQLLTFTATASDPNGDALTLSASPLPIGAAFTPSTGVFAWTPDFTQAGSYQITFTASDGTLSDTETITITVVNVNRAPLADAGPDRIGQVGDLISFTGSGSDPDGDALTYAWDFGDGAQASGSASVTHAYQAAGTYTVTLSISDGTITTTDTATATISNLPRNAFLGQYFDNKNLTNLKLTRVDAVINFNWGSGSPASTIAPNTFSVRWEGNWDLAASGTYRFTATTDDGIRLWIDDVLVLNRWVDGSKTSLVDRTLAAGTHHIKVEYYENQGKAVATLSWALR